jgi:hypothetical protein
MNPVRNLKQNMSTKTHAGMFSNGVKKYFFLSFILCSLVVAHHAMAQGFVPLAPIPGLTGEGDVSATTQGLPTFFNNLYKFLIGIAAVAAVFQIIRAGIALALNQGSVSEIISAKGRVAQSIWGLVIVLTPALVFGIINPNILNLSVALPDITYTDRGNSPQQTSITATEGDCTVTRSEDGRFVFGRCQKADVAANYACPGGANSRISFCPSELGGNCPTNFFCPIEIRVMTYSLIQNRDRVLVATPDQASFNSFSAGCLSVGGEVYIDDDFGPYSVAQCPSDQTFPQGTWCQGATISCTIEI